jgi:charged multivesicular body protein 6
LVEKDVVFGLQQGSAVLTEINKEMSLESVEKLMDDTADAIAYQEVQYPSSSIFNYQEVSNLLATRVTNEEEEEVLEELEQMHREALGLPNVPIRTLPNKEPVIKEDVHAVPEQEREEERQAILA